MSMRVVAVGQDAYWLEAVNHAMAGWAGDSVTVKCPEEFPDCISNLPAPEVNTVLLVDASGQGEMEQVVAGLRRKIEPDPSRPCYLVNWRGTPEGGYQCFPEGRPE